MALTPSERSERVRDKRAQVVRDFKVANGCLVCGTKNWRVLELDHRDPSTKHPRLRRPSSSASGHKPGSRGWRALSFTALEEEVKKCDVLCANHHRVRTAWMNGWKEKFAA